MTEEASVHPSDWPYERAPLATECGEGWRLITDACHDEGYILIGGDQDRPCPECTYDGFHDGPYGPDGDWGGDAA